MIRLVHIIAGLSVSASAFAARPTWRPVKAEVVLNDVKVEAVNGGINPDAEAFRVSGRILLGSNSCYAQGLRGTLRVEKAAEGTRHIVPYVQGRQRSDLICIEIYQPVYADVSVTVRGYSDLAETVFVRNAEEFGALRPLSSFTNASADSCETPAICPRDYNPSVCSVDGVEIQGSNLCGAQAAAKKFACLNGINLQPNQIKCTSSFTLQP